MRRFVWLILLLHFTCGQRIGQQAQGQNPGQGQRDDEGIRFFEERIRPALAQHCYSCHSLEAQRAKKLQGGLFLDSAAGLLEGGDSGPAIVQGKSAESLLIKALRHDGLEMPPAGKLPDALIADFAQWIDRGAPDPRDGAVPLRPKREIDIEAGRRWWAFRPLRPVPPPDAPDPSASASPTAGSGTPPDRSLVSPIDRFLLHAQRQQGLRPGSRASREKLLRRAFFDLIGLPPTPEQLEAFLRDESPTAFAAVIDRLLDDPGYGEKWARHWLDAARYAESGGYEFDGFRPGAYHYRDWVIRAWNRDLPFDQFIRQQLAGDKLTPDDYDGAAASGFLVAGPYPGQITAKTVERIRYDQIDDMLMTVGGSMLGMTIGCVRCHEHKYDPIPQEDYYALAASLQSTVHGSRQLDPDPAKTITAQKQHQAATPALLAAVEAFASGQFAERFETWKAELSKQPDSTRWQTFEPISAAAERSWLKWQANGLLLHDGAMPVGSLLSRGGESRRVGGQEIITIVARTHQKNIQSLRLDALTDKSLPQKGPGLNGDGSFQLAELKVLARPLDPQAKDPPIELALKPSFAGGADPDQPLANALDGKMETAWTVRATARADNAAIFELASPLAGFDQGTELEFQMRFADQGLGRFRWSFSIEPNPATWAGEVTPQHLGELRSLLAAGNQQLAEGMRRAMMPWFSRFDAEAAKVWDALRTHRQSEPRPSLPEVYTTTAGGQDVYLLRRGEVDSKIEKARPGFVRVLYAPTDAVPNPLEEAATDPRVRLANWMVDVEHGAGSLLARVIVNRLWQHHFGRGLVATPNDFGAQGERPSHPELLEWLSSELVQSGWKLKAMHKRIMLSEAYQLSHDVIPENLALDPDNRYLWHYRPRRLDAELVRDALLATGGNLDRAMFGPSLLDDSVRRSVYLRVKRSELSPWLTTFDAPEPTQSIGQRVSTTVPTQALTLLNSAFVRRQAELLARRVRSAPDVPLAQAVDQAYRVALGRAPAAAERDEMLAFIEEQAALAGSDATARDRALVEFCQVLFCLSEFMYID
ncbi:MAG: DUF1553 domain-containing protein [Planctomycetes bacterium]|nr:DUF1553 domain-containing protein [Planctomycetota bacterium]